MNRPPHPGLPWPLAAALMAVAAALMVPVVPCRADDALDRVREVERQRTELIRRISPAVISIFRVNSRTGDLAPGSGSGVIISPDGYALTNFHVTGPAQELRTGTPGGTIYPARRCGVDPTGDIAVIKIDSDEPLPYAALGSSDALSVGEWVIAMGNPFLLATDFRPTVSLGVVSGLDRYLPGGGFFRHQLIYANAIQVDAALNPGNSGGPLFNMRGQLVGINGRIAPRRVEGMRMQKINAGIGFAVSIDRIKPFFNDLKACRDIDRGYLGIAKADPVDGGLKIERIKPDSPAEVFGLQIGDIVVSIDGIEIREADEVSSLIQVRPAGSRINVEVRRDDQTHTITVQLAGIQSTMWLRMARMSRRAAGTKSILRETPPETDEEAPGEDDQPAPEGDQSEQTRPDDGQKSDENTNPEKKGND